MFRPCPVSCSHTASLAGVILVIFLPAFIVGCSPETNNRLEDRAPERLRGVSLSYDVAGLNDDPSRDPPPVPLVRPTYPSTPAAKMLVWWQTPDGVVHHREVETRGGTINPERYAGSLWVEVTPIGGRPKRLGPASSTGPASQPAAGALPQPQTTPAP